jgi:hypothetical protein
MPNAIKYSTSAQTLALKKGNFWIGTGDVGKGPTSTTDYYNGITPPSGGYTIYLNKASGGPSIYCPANDAALISLTNSIAGASYTTAAQCLDYFATQTDKMVFNADYPAIVTNGLILNLDAGFTPSYPTTGTTWYDVSSSVNNGTLTNGPTFSSANGGSIVFDGVDDYVNVPYDASKISFPNNNATICVWFNSSPAGDGYGCLVTQRSGNGFNTYVYQNKFYADGGGTQGVQSTTTIVKGTTYFGCAVYDKTNSLLKIYVNGNYETQISYTGNIQDTFSIRLGNTSTFSDGPYPGNIYVAQVYNRVLSDSEVLQNFNATKSRFGL